jgi:hypothetical protein
MAISDSAYGKRLCAAIDLIHGTGALARRASVAQDPKDLTADGAFAAQTGCRRPLILVNAHGMILNNLITSLPESSFEEGAVFVVGYGDMQEIAVPFVVARYAGEKTLVR